MRGVQSGIIRFPTTFVLKIDIFIYLVSKYLLIGQLNHL